jgi:hypothetical protein
MKKPFSSFLSIFLMFIVLASSSAYAVTKSEAMEQRRSRPRLNLDTGEMTPEPVDNTLKHHSYVLPFLPKGTMRVHNAPEAGPCTQEGVVYRDAISKRSCGIYSSSKGVFKIQRYQERMVSYMPRIWKKVDGNWVLWAEFDTGGQVTYASTEAARFAGRSVPNKAEDKPQYADTPPATPAEIPHVPSLGTILEDIIRKSR